MIKKNSTSRPHFPVRRNNYVDVHMHTDVCICMYVCICLYIHGSLYVCI